MPLLPRRMAADLLQCPTPFLLGLDAATASGLDLPKDAVQVRVGHGLGDLLATGMGEGPKPLFVSAVRGRACVCAHRV